MKPKAKDGRRKAVPPWKQHIVYQVLLQEKGLGVARRQRDSPFGLLSKKNGTGRGQVRQAQTRSTRRIKRLTPCLIGVFASKDGGGAPQDREVERERPVVDVLDIGFDALDHLFDVPGFAPVAPHLGQVPAKTGV